MTIGDGYREFEVGAWASRKILKGEEVSLGFVTVTEESFFTITTLTILVSTIRGPSVSAALRVALGIWGGRRTKVKSWAMVERGRLSRPKLE